MKLQSMMTLALVGSLLLVSSTYAQNLPMNNSLFGQDAFQFPARQMTGNTMPLSSLPANRPLFGDFPSADELAKMVPPEPLTEQNIRQRFASQREVLQKAIEQDRKRAEKYAHDFARYQKLQAEQLAKIMANAKIRQEQMLNNLNRREQRALENFRKRQQNDSAAVPRQPD